MFHRILDLIVTWVLARTFDPIVGSGFFQCSGRHPAITSSLG
ncbi:protein of unknown function [Pararobbsia alpina]